MKQHCLFLLAGGILASPACTHLPPEPATPATIRTASTEQQRLTFIERIAELPVFLVHEEEPAEFRKSLGKGEYFCTGDGKSYLSIRGDGTFGRRVFIGLPDGTLKVNMLSSENVPCYELYRYNEAQKCLELESTTPLDDSDINPGYMPL